MAQIPKTMPPKFWTDEGRSVMAWEMYRQQAGAFDSGFDLWRNLEPAARLDWVLNFIQTDLNKLTEQERAHLGYVLKSIGPGPVHVGAAAYGSTAAVALSPMSDSSLTRIQRMIADGVRGLAGRQGAFINFPGPLEISFFRMNPPITIGRGGAEVPGKLKLQYTWNWGGNDVGRVMYGVADLLLTPAGRNLRLCLNDACKKPFIGRKRELYCSKACGQARRDAKKAAKVKEQAKAPAKRRATK